MSIIRICIKIGSRGERRLAGAHCARRGAEYLHSFQFDPTSNMLKLPPPHQLSAFLPTFSSRLLQQKSAFFLSLTNRSCPFSSRWKVGGSGHLIKSSETKLLRHLHLSMPVLSSASIQLQKKIYFECPSVPGQIWRARCKILRGW